MANNFREWSKITEQIQKNSVNPSSLWDTPPEEEQKNIEKIKKQWQKKQHREFKRIRHEESQNKNIKVIVSSFLGVTLIALAFPHLANWWQMKHITELSPEETPEDGGKKGGFLNKLKALKEDEEGEANSQKPQEKKAGIGEQLEESIDSIKQNRHNLKKAIDLSDGKEINLEREKNK
jgi:hypothetical protein